MATTAIDTGNMRSAGAAITDYFKGMNGRCLVLGFVNVANADVVNVGNGCQWVAWENPSSSATTAAAPILSGDRVTFEASSSYTGNLWCFYKDGSGGPNTGGTTHAPDSVNEVSREAYRLRPVIFSMTAIGNNNSVAYGMTGIRHALTRPNGSGTGGANVRFSSAANQAIGTLTWTTSATNRQCRLICLVQAGSGI